MRICNLSFDPTSHLSDPMLKFASIFSEGVGEVDGWGEFFKLGKEDFAQSIQRGFILSIHFDSSEPVFFFRARFIPIVDRCKDENPALVELIVEIA